MSTIKTLDVKVNGLHPNKKYRFNFANKGGNWPVRVSPLSGVFYPSSVKTYVYFCSTTGECPPSDPNVFFNTLASDISIPGLDLDNKSLYSVLQLSISEFDCDTVVYTHPCIIECDECIPRLSIGTNSVSLGSSEGSEATFSSSVDGLVPNQSYKYEFSGIEGNWPVKIIPKSGIIKTSDSSYTINGLVSICQSPTMCPSGTPNVLNYTTMPNKSDLLYSLVELSVEPVDEINSNFQALTKSAFSIQCDDCIHRLVVNTPSTVTAATADASFVANAVNTVPGRTYKYSIESVDANWPILVHPSTGTLVATSDNTNLLFYTRFCPSTGVCPSGTTGLLPYSLNNSSSLMPKQARLKVKLEDACGDSGVVCSNNYGPTTLTYSNETTILCDNCLPAPQAQALPIVVATEVPKRSLTTTIDNLMPGSTYNYVFKGLGGNWPAVINPVSGSFIASSNTRELSADITFCVSTGVCPNTSANVLTYTIDNAQLNSGAQSIYTKLRLELENASYDLPKIYGAETLFTCDNCLPKITASIPELVTLSNTDTYSFNAQIDNTVPGQEYSYVFKNVGSNWPAVIYPISGTILATSNNETVPITLQFCSTTGICATGLANVLGYSLDPTPLTSKRARLKMQVNTVNYASATVNSNDLDVKCDNCLYETSFSTPSSLTLTPNNSTDNFTTIISGLVPGETYRYTYKSTNSNWPILIYPISGTINATGPSFSIPTRLTFGSATGLCPSGSRNVLDYVTDTCCSVISNGVKSAAIRLELDPVNTKYSKSYSDQIFVTCDDCIQTLSASLPSYITLANDDSQIINADIDHLLPGRTYKYLWKSVEANWPGAIYPVSGTITPTGVSDLISSKISFCPSTGVCPSGLSYVLPYTLSPECMTEFGIVDKNIKLQLEVTDMNCSDVTTKSNISSVLCDNCLNKLAITNAVLDATLSSGNSIYSLNSIISNLIPGESYKYNINYIDSNWPCIVSKQSGEFSAFSSSKIIKTNIGFCYPSGSCVTDSKDAILTYSTNSLDNQLNRKFITLNVSVDAVDCSIPRAYSDNFTLLCESCLPMNKLNVDFSGYPTVSLSGCSCSGTQLALVTVTGAIPNTNYDYIFSSSSNKLTLSPSSGTTSFGSSGSGSIMSIMNLSFSSGDKSVVQMKLRDTSSNIEAVSQLAVQCLANQSCKIIPPLYAKFVDSPQLTLAECACSGSRLISVSVTGALPNNFYDYTLTSTSNKISFSPSSGTMLFNSSGSGTIASIFNLALTSGDQSIVQFRLKDTTNQIEAIDYLPVKCSGTCN